MEGKKTIIVNLIGAPGVGKSTTMAGVFSILKQRGVDCEQATEFAKELVWERREETFKDELYIFAKQYHRLFIVVGKVDVVVTDRPLVITACYNNISPKPIKGLSEMAVNAFSEYRNINIYLNRVKKYNPNGRNQTERESDKIGKTIRQILDDNHIDYDVLDADENVVAKVVDKVLTELNKQGEKVRKRLFESKKES